jgi:hypothetical protein
MVQYQLLKLCNGKYNEGNLVDVLVSTMKKGVVLQVEVIYLPSEELDNSECYRIHMQFGYHWI